MLDQFSALLSKLLAARSIPEVFSVLSGIGDSPDVSLGQPTADAALECHPFGDNLSNISTIGLAAKPGRSLSERLTKAMDAVLEEHSKQHPTPPNSARLAGQQWYGRLVCGPVVMRKSVVL